MYGGKTRDRNWPIGNKISEQIGGHYHENRYIPGGEKGCARDKLVFLKFPYVLHNYVTIPHYHAEKTPDCRLKLASNEGSLSGQRKCIPIRFDVNKEMLSRIILKAK